MTHLTRTDLYPLERYALDRKEYRARVLAHKLTRKLALGPNMTLQFEDRLTIQYQVQEMLRIERIFEPDAIQEELDAYNPLIPDGSNFKATLLIEYPDATERARELARLRGIEHSIVIAIGDDERVRGRADEDLDRSNEDKTSAVHFLRFEFNAKQRMAIKSGQQLVLSVDDLRYPHSAAVSAELARQLALDLD